MIPVATPDLGGREEEYVLEALRSGFVSSAGPFVPRFEALVAAAAGVSRAAATASGTSALHLALHVAGVAPGDLVVCPSFSFVATANAIRHAHAIPWFVDVKLDTWGLDPFQVSEILSTRAIRQDGKLVHRTTGRRIAAILAVHAVGLPAAMDQLATVARHFQIPLLADGAAALGATRSGVPVGRLADITVFSFNGNKVATTGGGGAIVSSDSATVQRAAHLAGTARTGPDYDHDEVAFNYRLSNLGAALGVAQLERLKAMIARKRALRAAYADLAQEFGLNGFPNGDGEGTAWLSGLVLPTGTLAREIREALAERGVESRSFWRPLHRQVPYQSAPQDPAPVAESLDGRIITLPCSSWMDDSTFDQVLESTRFVLNRTLTGTRV